LPGSRWPRRHLGAVSARGGFAKAKVKARSKTKPTLVKFLIKLFSKSLWGVGQSPTTCNRMCKAWVTAQGKNPKGLMNNE
jgi:hypothetical protein